jgi:hypothetical protein
MAKISENDYQWGRSTKKRKEKWLKCFDSWLRNPDQIL